MAQDDYYVIVYQILSYLYQRLKKGEDVDPLQISSCGDYFRINKRYWDYIMVNLFRDGYIKGLNLIELDDMAAIVSGVANCEITPKGIAFLTEESTINKAKKFFKEAKDFLVPFV